MIRPDRVRLGLIALGCFFITAAPAENYPPDPKATLELMQHLSASMEALNNNNRLSPKIHKALEREMEALLKSLSNFGDSAFDEPFGSCFEAGRIWIQWAETRLKADQPLPKQISDFKTWKTACDHVLEELGASNKGGNPL